MWRASASARPPHVRATLRVVHPPRLLPQYQPATRDTTPDGAGGRARRVAEAEDRGQPPHSWLPLPPATAYEYPVAICAVAKDQGADLAEWAAWHARLGVSKMWVYDDGSRPPLTDAVALAEQARIIPRGVVSVAPLPPDAAELHPSRRAQMAAYDACVRDHRHEAAWLAFIDVDEFLTVQGDAVDAFPPSLPAILAAYPTAAALVVHWRVFGSGGHVTPPPAGVVASFTACVPPSDPESSHVKTIARSAVLATVEPCLGPHHFAYAAGFYAVDGAGRRVDGPTSPYPPTYAPLALHHYSIKSAAEFAAKAARGSGMGNRKGAAYRESVDARATDVCDQAAVVAAGVGFGDVFG